MTALEIVLIVALILAVSWIVKRERDVQGFREYCRRLRASREIDRFLVGMLAAASAPLVLAFIRSRFRRHE